MKITYFPTLFVLLACLMTTLSRSQETPPKVTEKVVTYTDGETTLEGFFVMPTLKGAQISVAGVMVVHDWTGVQDYTKKRARQLATELGVAAFCCDIYGQGVRPTDPKDCASEAGKYKRDRALFRRRLQLGLNVLLGQKWVDEKQISAIGYCFGGTGVLELARSGAAVQSVVSFHGGLDSLTPADAAKIKASVLILHGAADPFVPQKDIDACLKEFNDAKVDWQMVSYSGAVHSFTKPDAGDDPSKGAAYDASADRRSWIAMRNFLAEKLTLTSLARRRVVLSEEERARAAQPQAK